MAEIDDQMTQSPNEETPWWSMSPKTQVIVIAVAIGLFNCLLIAILAAVFLLRSG